MKGDEDTVDDNICQSIRKMKIILNKVLSKKNLSNMNLEKFIKLINSAYRGVCKNDIDKRSFTSIIKASMIEVNDLNNIEKFHFCKNKDALDEFELGEQGATLLFYIIKSDGELVVYNENGIKI